MNRTGNRRELPATSCFMKLTIMLLIGILIFIMVLLTTYIIYIRKDLKKRKFVLLIIAYILSTLYYVLAFRELMKSMR